MLSPAALAADPHWLPHAFDPARQNLTFAKLPRARLAATAFLADIARETGYETTEVPLATLASAVPAPSAPVTFIFHTAFCRSTLLARALEQPGISTGLSEPGIIASLAGAGPAGQGAVAPVAALLARPWSAGEAVFIKPTNHANRLAPALMQALPQARAVLMSNPLPSFLAAVVRKGMMGRRWGRQLYLEMMSYAGMDLGMDGREQFLMTDLQATGLAWFLNQRFLAALVQNFGARVRVLDGDAFGRDPAKTLAAVYAFAGHAVSPEQVAAIASGPVFAADAKTGEDYAAKSARDAEATRSSVTEDEIAKVGEWVNMIARQAGLSVPLAQTL
ncbi:MAG: hypothetical protein O9266_08540 [Porphyrobacter sp.]|jgi:hypothetical protein|nr:hypothetical protein [Porphyrobacter sp.]